MVLKMKKQPIHKKLVQAPSIQNKSIQIASTIKKGEGFSLVELLAVMVLLGLLSAIATPIYLKYKKNMALNLFLTNSAKLGRATIDCFSKALQPDDISECDELTEIGLRCDSCKTQRGATDPTNHKRICYEMELSVGGNQYLSCVSIDTDALAFQQTIKGPIGGSSQHIKHCYKDNPPDDPLNPNNCQTGSFDVCDTIVHPLQECQVATDCSGVGSFCHQAQGKCDLSDGSCK